MSQVAETTTPTTLSVTAVCFETFLITVTVMLASTSVCQTILGQHSVVLPPQWILRNTIRCYAVLTIMPHQQPQSKVPSQAYAHYAMGPPQVSFSFRVEPPNDSLCHMLLSVMVFAFCFQVPKWLPCSLMRFNHWGLQCHNPSEFTLGRHTCLLMIVCGPCQECTK